MKKILFIAAVALPFVLGSCQKEALNIDRSEGRTITFSVDENGLDLKSAYTAGKGVALTKDEPIALFYRKDSLFYGVDASTTPILATSSAKDGVYSFTAPAGVADTCKWFSLMPYSKLLDILNSKHNAVKVRLSPVQYPGQNTFDPACDYLIGKAFSSTTGSGAVTQFKRMFAPLKLNLSGLSSTDKIYTVSLMFNTTDLSTGEGFNALTGCYNVQFGDEYADNYITSYESGNYGPASGDGVSAIYPEGLSAAADGSFPVWFMVSPCTKPAGTFLYVIVSTADSSYIKVVPLPSAIEVVKGKINTLNVDVKSEGYVNKSVRSVTQVFSGLSALPAAASLTASNGKAYNWAFSGSLLWNGASKDPGSYLKNALSLGGQSFTVPSLNGLTVKEAIVYTHPYNNLSAAYDSYLKVSKNGVEKSFGFNLCPTANYEECLYNQAGYADLQVDAISDLTGATIAAGSTRATMISAITYVVDGTESDPSDAYEEASANDLYAEFEAGKKITINGVAYTKDSNPAYYSDDLSSATNSELQKAGIHFLAGTKDFGSSANFKLPNGVVYISRYKNTPASLSASQFQPYADCVMKNVKLNANNANNAFPNTNYTADSKLVFEDCELTLKGGLTRDVNTAYSVKELVINHCTVSTAAKSLYFLNTSKKSGAGSPTLISVKNSNITATKTLSTPMLNPGEAGSAYTTPSLEIVVEGNTVSGYASVPGLVNVSSAKSVSIKNNTFTANLSSATDTDGNAVTDVAACAVAGTYSSASVVSGNTFTNTGATGSWAVSASVIENLTAAGNNI